MAAYQVAESLKPGDNRVKGVEREWSSVSSAQMRARFFAIYSEAFHLPKKKESSSPCEAPSKALASQEQEQEQEQDIGAPSAKSPRGTALPADWQLPENWKTWAQAERQDLDVQLVADSFRDYWVAKPGKDGRKADWQATWRNWVRNQRAEKSRPVRAASDIGAFV